MAKERTITRTITTNTVTVFGANFRERTFEQVTKDITGKIDEKDLMSIFAVFASSSFAPSEIVNVSTKTEKRGMTEEDFINNSFLITDETKISERLVTRTITKNTVTVFGADFSNKTFHSVTRHIGGKIDEWENKSDILKAATTDTFIAYSIENVETTTERRGMTEEDFIKKSVPVSDDTEE